MRLILILLSMCLTTTGCAPRQDPGVPLPPPGSGAAALGVADAAVAPQANVASAIDAAKRVIAENLRNAETTGYKALCCRVQDGKAEIYLDLEQGALETTDRNLDIAINGPGFLRVKTTPGGDAFTRNGNLFTNKDGQLVVGIGDGFPLIPPITIPTDVVDITISQDGHVAVLRANQNAKQDVGRIELSRFPDPQHLIRDGTLYRPGPLCGKAFIALPRENGNGSLQQGFLEASNVDLNREKLRTDFLDRWRNLVMR